MSSMFASRFKKEVRVEVEPDVYEVVTIRKLSGVSLEKAAEAHRMTVIQTVKVYGSELLGFARERSAELKERKAAEAEAAPAPVPVPVPEPEPVVELTPEQKAAALKVQQEARYGEYDKQLVLQAGIVSWTAPEKVNPENIADLDEKVSTLLFREILDASLPPLVEDVSSKG